MKKLLPLLAVGFALSMTFSPVAFAAAHTGGVSTDCAAKSLEKKLAGAAKSSFEKKCMADAGGAMDATSTCEKSAADKKLAGAAKSSFMKKCVADAGSTDKPMAAAKPAAAASAAKK